MTGPLRGVRAEMHLCQRSLPPQVEEMNSLWGGNAVAKSWPAWKNRSSLWLSEREESNRGTTSKEALWVSILECVGA